MCVVEFDDYPSTFRETRSTARKDHRCAACDGAVRPGERYLRYFYVVDGEAFHGACCEACEAISDRFAKEHNGQRPFADSLYDVIQSCVADGDPDSARWQADLDAMDARQKARLAA